jgi:hypothetical protein
MTADPNGWPDASKPGVPLNPERDGWHWLLWKGGAQPVPLRWNTGLGGGWSSYSTDGTAARYLYLGPCLTPAEVAAREQAAAVAMRGVCANELEVRALEVERMHARYDASGFPVGGPSMTREVAVEVAAALAAEAKNIRGTPTPTDIGLRAALSAALAGDTDAK